MTDRPRLLDLFCGAGGAGAGYARAGFDVHGVDSKERLRYPFDRSIADALDYADVHGPTYDAIHASPPCQAYSITRRTHSNQHPDLVGVTRDLLVALGKPFVIENVVGAPLRDPLTLCGTMFDRLAVDRNGERLFLRRHRWFESDILLFAAGACRCAEWKRAGLRIGGVYGHGSNDQTYAVRGVSYTPRTEVKRRLIGADWMTDAEVNQSIPPDYTEWIGRQLIEAVR